MIQGNYLSAFVQLFTRFMVVISIIEVAAPAAIIIVTIISKLI